MLNRSGLPIPFLITPAWRNFLVACYSEANFLFSCTVVSKESARRVSCKKPQRHPHDIVRQRRKTMAEKPRDMLANVERLHHLMDQHGYAAVVVRSGKNVTYLSGVAYPGTLARHLDFPDSPREVLLVWPRHSTPVLIVNHYAAPLAQRDSWVQHCEVYDDYAESPYERLATVLEHLGLHE